MADALMHLHLPLPHLPKLSRPRLHLSKRHREEALPDDGDDPAAPLGAEKDDDDTCMPAVQRVQAEASEAYRLFNLPSSEVRRSPLAVLPRLDCASRQSWGQASRVCWLRLGRERSQGQYDDGDCAADNKQDVAQDYIDGFECSLQESYVALLGRLSVFREHLGFHSSWPFDYVVTLVIPLKVCHNQVGLCQ